MLSIFGIKYQILSRRLVQVTFPNQNISDSEILSKIRLLWWSQIVLIVSSGILFVVLLWRDYDFNLAEWSVAFASMFICVPTLVVAGLLIDAFMRLKTLSNDPRFSVSPLQLVLNAFAFLLFAAALILELVCFFNLKKVHSSFMFWVIITCNCVNFCGFCALTFTLCKIVNIQLRYQDSTTSDVRKTPMTSSEIVY